MTTASRRADGSFDITLTLEPSPQGYKLHLAYPPDVFPDTVEDALARAGRYLAQERLAGRTALVLARAMQEVAQPVVGPDGRPLDLRRVR